jgi:hypothetical protein
MSALLPEQIEKMTADDDVMCAFGSSRNFATQVRESAYDPKCKAEVRLQFWHVVEYN